MATVKWELEDLVSKTLHKAEYQEIEKKVGIKKRNVIR